MSALEQTLLDKIRTLDEQSQLRVLEFVNNLEQPKMSWEERQKRIEKKQRDLSLSGIKRFFYRCTCIVSVRSCRCDFWTADERLYNALSASLAWVKFIGNFTP